MASPDRSLTLSLLLALLVPACGGDDKQSTATDSTSSTGSTDPIDSTGTTDPAATTDEPGTSSTTGTSGTTAEQPTSTAGTDTTASTTEPATSTSTTQTTGPDLDCVTIEPGPFAPEKIASGFGGSEDLGFDGAGGLALKRDGAVVIVTADLQETQLADGLPQVYGTRFATTGDLLIALPQSGDLQAIAGDGTITDLVGGLESPNGLYVDPTGGVWLTEFGGARIVRFDAEFTPTTVYEGPMAGTANGVVLDPERGLLFFTNYAAGRLLKLAVDDQGAAIGEPVEVAQIQNAALDGLVLDECGNLYAVDQGNDRIYRAILDGDAAIVGSPELLAEFDSNVANAQFGWGGDWDRASLYVAGNPGDLYRVTVGVEGAPIGLP